MKDGFLLPESKGDVSWRDANTLYIASDFGPGTLTKSGYPRIVKEWKRGTPLAAGEGVFEGAGDRRGLERRRGAREPGGSYDLLRRAITFWEGEDYLREGDKWVKVDVPRDARIEIAARLALRAAEDRVEAGGRPTSRRARSSPRDLDKFMAGGRDFDGALRAVGARGARRTTRSRRTWSSSTSSTT